MLLVFSDLDGTILDQDNYSTEESSEGISLLKENDIPLILTSAKTRAEMEVISAELDLNSPFIFENGAGIDLTGSGINGDCIMLSPPFEEFRKVFSSLLSKGYKLKAVTDMSIKEIIDLTGLSERKAGLALMRTGSFPFVVKNEKIIDIDRTGGLNHILSGSGFKIVTGTRFYHLVPESVDKAAALKRVADFYKNRMPGEMMYTFAIGDAANDIEMLKAADEAFFVGTDNQEKFSESITFTSKKGPEGFTEAVKNIVKVTTQLY